MKRGYVFALLLALVLASLALLGIGPAPATGFVPLESNPDPVNTPYGTPVPVGVRAQYTDGQGQHRSGLVRAGPAEGVTITMTDSSGLAQTFVTRDDGLQLARQQFRAIVGQLYTVTASYGASTSSMKVVIYSRGDPAVSPTAPFGGLIYVAVIPADGGLIQDLRYSAPRTPPFPDPRFTVDTPVGTPVPVTVDAYYLDSVTGGKGGPVAGMRVRILADQCAVFADITDNPGPLQLMAGHKYTAIAEFDGVREAKEITVTSLGPGRPYAAGGAIRIAVDPGDNSIADISYDIQALPLPTANMAPAAPLLADELVARELLDPYNAPTPSGTPLQIWTISQYGDEGPIPDDRLGGVTIRMTDASGFTQSSTTAGYADVDSAVPLNVVVGQQYIVTAAYGASTAWTKVTITGHGNPASLQHAPYGGLLEVIVRPSDGRIVMLAYRLSQMIVMS